MTRIAPLVRRWSGIRVGMVAAAATTLFACAVPGVASGDTVTVTTTADQLAPDPCSPSACTLRGAVELAPPGRVILVPPGDYMLVNDLQTNFDLTIQAAGPGTRLIATTGDRVLTVSTGTLTVSGVEITDGVASTGDGGGVFVDADGALRLANSTVRNNEADNGGGIWVEGALVLTRSTVSGNEALGDDPDGSAAGSGSARRRRNARELDRERQQRGQSRGRDLHGERRDLRNVTIADNTAPPRTGPRRSAAAAASTRIREQPRALTTRRTPSSCRTRPRTAAARPERPDASTPRHVRRPDVPRPASHPTLTSGARTP